MELARVFAESGLEFDATLVFICWAGEEQGLIGSAAHAQRIAAEKVPVEAMISNDIVGNSRSGTGIVDAASVRVFAVGPEDSPSRALARYIVAAGATYVPSHRVRPMAREDRFGRGSDHLVHAAGLPAVVFREANENFTGSTRRRHPRRRRLPLPGAERAGQRRGRGVAGAGAAGAGRGRRARRCALGRDPRATTPRCAGRRRRARPAIASTGATGRNDWQHARTVGNVTEHVLPGMIDRRLCLRDRGDRTRRARESHRRLRLAGAARDGPSSW